jgi:hypothetical protein
MLAITETALKLPNLERVNHDKYKTTTSRVLIICATKRSNIINPKQIDLDIYQYHLVNLISE